MGPYNEKIALAALAEREPAEAKVSNEKGPNMIKKFSKEGQFECGLAEAVAGKVYAFVPIIGGKGQPEVGLGVAFANSPGYMAVPASWCWGEAGDFDAMDAHADELNAEIGINPEAAAIIVCSSMVGKVNPEIKAGGLVLVHEASGAPVKVGDLVKDFRGDLAKVVGGSPPRHAPSSGRVEVISYAPGIKVEGEAEFYPSVFGLKWIKACDEHVLSFGEGDKADPDRCVHCNGLFLRDAAVPFSYQGGA